MTEITDEMVERFVREMRCDRRHEISKDAARAVLTVVLSPPTEPEIPVSEGMINKGRGAMNAWWDAEDNDSEADAVKSVYRAMERQRLKENGPSGAACAAVYSRSCGSDHGYSTLNQRSGRGRRKDDK